MEKIDIILVTHRKKEEVQQQINEIERYTPEQHRLIVTCQPLSASLNRNYGLSYVNSEIFVMCFRGDMIVEEMNNGCKKIKDIKIGDYVKTHTGKFRKVIKKFKRELKNNTKLYFIKTKNCLTKVTEEHPFYVLKKNKYIWVKAKNLSLNDILLYPNNYNKDNYLDIKLNIKRQGNRWNNNKQKNKKIKINSDISRFMGLYLAEGYFTKDEKRIVFCFNNNEIELHNFIKNVWKKYFNNTYVKTVRHATEIILTYFNIGKYFKKMFGDNALTKKVPFEVYTWNLINRLNFIYGYFLGDGTKKDGILTSISKQLIEDIKKLCNDSGIQTSKIFINKKRKFYYKRENRIIKSKQFYRIKIYSHSMKKMLDLINNKNENGYIKIPITKIKETKISSNLNKRTVYNLEVEKDNSYIVNSSIIHNCDDDVTGFFSGWLTTFVMPMLKDTKIIISSARLLDKDKNIAHMMGAFKIPREAIGIHEAERFAYKNYYRVATACIGIRKNEVKFDEGFKGSGYEDTTYMNRINEKFPDRKMIVNCNCKLVHLNEEKNQGGEYFEHNKAHYLELFPDDPTVINQKDWTKRKR